MNALVLVWMTVCLWTTGSSLIQIESEFVLYPPLNGTATLTCECSNQCQTIFWFRTHSKGFQFLISINSADRIYPGEFVGKERFKPSYRKDSSTLRISNIESEDAGMYSCVLWNLKDTELWRPGILLKPGETRPTLPPTTTMPRPPRRGNPNGRCTKGKNRTTEGCDSNVFWVLVGVMLALAVALLSTMYYFSRLPKKCRHRFVKYVPCLNFTSL
uniref:Ig-like domain-containing protein n=1 Tax=Esox lucius TaxID=8010 RepID=A0AAY5L880_ESOLU